MFLGITILLIVAEGIWQIIINYPPSMQQINIGVINIFTLWIVKIISLILLIFSTYFFSTGLNIKVKRYYWIIVFAVPTLSLIWMSYPLDALKIFIISILFYLISKKIEYSVFRIIFGIIVIFLLNIIVFKEKPEILKVISLSQPRTEVNFRYQIEDNLNPNIHVPGILKRAVYNKIFFAFRDTLNLSLNFFDIETLFFQEVHPLGQKSFVMFFWPEIIIFILGAWLYTSKQKGVDSTNLILIIFSFAYFISSSASPERRLVLVIFPMATLLAKTTHLFISESRKKWRIVIIILLFLTFYGWMTNYFDRLKRPDYWLDNRPLAYNFILSNIKTIDHKYDQILVPNTLFAINDYCKYYLKTCPNFTFEDFDLLKQPVLKNTLYIGFIGNFIGKNSDYKTVGVGQDLEILYKREIQDNIANGYGQDLLIVKSKK